MSFGCEVEYQTVDQGFALEDVADLWPVVQMAPPEVRSLAPVYLSAYQLGEEGNELGALAGYQAVYGLRLENFAEELTLRSMQLAPD